MNNNLADLFSATYHIEHLLPEVGTIAGPGSTLEHTKYLQERLLIFFKKHHINSIFDAGCCDCNWMSTLVDQFEYHGGEISRTVVEHLQKNNPTLDIVWHDVTTDPLPAVDLLFVRDVAIHLNTADKQRLISNWISSEISWILMTQDDLIVNSDFEYNPETFPESQVNWMATPWNFPAPTDILLESENGNNRKLALWHRSQLL
jgi:hypothetical protein